MSNMWPNFHIWTVSTLGGDLYLMTLTDDRWQIYTYTNSLLVKLTNLRTYTASNIWEAHTRTLHTAAGKERIFWAHSRWSVALSSAASPPQNPFLIKKV